MTFIRAILPTARARLRTLEDTAPVVDAARLLSKTNTSLVIACDPEGLIAGVITKADVVRQISTCTGCSCTASVADIMTRNVVTCHPDDDLIDVWATMKSHALRQIPISSHDRRPLGLLYANDALQVLLKETEYEGNLLRDYIMGVGYH